MVLRTLKSSVLGLIGSGSLWMMSLSTPALAACQAPSSGFHISCENGVTVYRGQPSQANIQRHAGLQQAYKQRQATAQFKYQIQTQQLQLNQQAQTIDRLQTQISSLERRVDRTRQRGRYVRRYYRSRPYFGSYGYGSNGYIRHSHFRGTTRTLPRYKRKRH